MKVKLLRDKVLVVPVEMEEQTSGGIILPETVNSRPMYGEVVAVGPGIWQHGTFVPTAVKEGDVVMFHPTAGSLVELDGKDYILLHEREIFLVVSDGDPEDE